MSLTPRTLAQRQPQASSHPRPAAVRVDGQHAMRVPVPPWLSFGLPRVPGTPSKAKWIREQLTPSKWLLTPGKWLPVSQDGTSAARPGGHRSHVCLTCFKVSKRRLWMAVWERAQAYVEVFVNAVRVLAGRYIYCVT